MIDPGSCEDVLTITFEAFGSGKRSEVNVKVTSPLLFIAPDMSITVTLSTCFRRLPNVIENVDLHLSYELSGTVNLAKELTLQIVEVNKCHTLCYTCSDELN